MKTRPKQVLGYLPLAFSLNDIGNRGQGLRDLGLAPKY
jgi:hypothetical protein